MVIDDMPIDYSGKNSVLINGKVEGQLVGRGLKRSQSSYMREMETTRVLDALRSLGINSSLIDEDYAEFILRNQLVLSELFNNTCVRRELESTRNKLLLKPLLMLLVDYVKGFGEGLPSLYLNESDKRRRSLLSRKLRRIVGKCFRELL